MNNQKKEKSVVVGMSGGVDSSVAAALLVEQGYDVIGITMKTYEFDEVGGNIANEASCCGLGAVNDARMAAARIGIPHYVVDFRVAFGREVIDNFVEEYLRGRTPNPCVICNREIKWGELLRKAEALGVHSIATGHYARLHFDDPSGRVAVLQARYRQKDQSYALWGLSQEALSRTLFPLGEMTKPEVRTLATKYGLQNAGKTESYEICFVPDNRYDRFLKERVTGLEKSVAGGDLVWGDEVVGKHQGYPFYTIGQRKGLGAHGRKIYVTGIESSTNTVRIGTEGDLRHYGLVAGSVNWVSIPAPLDEIRVQAKVRYKDEATPATVSLTERGQIRVRFEEAKRAITPGQSVVLYDEDVLVGGGIIESVFE